MSFQRFQTSQSLPSLPEKKEVDFTIMGLDLITSQYLNWALSKRDNLEYLKECQTMELVSTQAVIHFNHLREIKRIDDAIIHTRA